MHILLACEESQRTTIELRKRGHEAFSCDILDCSGGHPEWHIKGDVLPYLNGNCTFQTMDGVVHTIKSRWDMIIAHPPCTYLAVSGNRWFDVAQYGTSALERIENREQAIDFFMKFVNADCDRIAIENPVGVMSSRYRKPDQIVQPYWFGDPERKATCFWFKNLQPLEPTDIVEPNIIDYGSGTDSYWHVSTRSLPAEQRRIARSKTFPGLAAAMAEQWTR